MASKAETANIPEFIRKEADSISEIQMKKGKSSKLIEAFNSTQSSSSTFKLNYCPEFTDKVHSEFSATESVPEQPIKAKNKPQKAKFSKFDKFRTENEDYHTEIQEDSESKNKPNPHKKPNNQGKQGKSNNKPNNKHKPNTNNKHHHRDKAQKKRGKFA